ncbi:hypothetical protein EBA04_08810 [Xanthomonas oryzae pv. oryzae]|nr:hypothetical protein EBA04_08810 [Xanthomonas oryzae pv. oryzae]
MSAAMSWPGKSSSRFHSSPLAFMPSGSFQPLSLSVFDIIGMHQFDAIFIGRLENTARVASQ